jgi:hypothetical protein
VQEEWWHSQDVGFGTWDVSCFHAW